MTVLLFEYGHTSVGSWNGDWAGRGATYAKQVAVDAKKLKELKELGVSTEIGSKSSFFYDFGDGWKAKVWMTVGYKKDFKDIMKVSKGFLGYDWMIDEILSFGRILSKDERKQVIKI